MGTLGVVKGRPYRTAIVSIRLSDHERAFLQRMAAVRRCTISDVLRGLIASEFAEPLPGGVSVGSHARINEGIFWRTPSGDGVEISGASGNNLTIFTPTAWS